MYPGEHASAIMPLQRWSEDRIWSVTFLAKLRDERSWRTTTERVCYMNNCVDRILGGESERVQMKCPPPKKKGADTHIQIGLIVIQTINAATTSQFSSRFEPLACLSFHVRHPATEKGVDQNRSGPNTDNVWAGLLQQTFPCIVSEDSDLLAVL